MNQPRPDALDVVPVGDLRNEIDWERYLEGIDAVVHLAALAHITSSIPEAEYDRVNRWAAVRLAKAASSAGAKFIFVSSIAAQSGPSSKTVLTEHDRPCPTTPYGRAKLHAEQEISTLSNSFVTLRPTLIYGSGVIGNMQRLMRLALLPVPPPFALIHNRRSLLAIENLCQAILFALKSKAALKHTFLVADRDPISTADMVAQLRRGAGLSPTQIPIPPSVLFATLRFLGRGEMQEKIGGDLVASVEKLQRFGFRWLANTNDSLYSLGSSNRARHLSSSSIPQELGSKAALEK